MAHGDGVSGSLIFGEWLMILDLRYRIRYTNWCMCQIRKHNILGFVNDSGERSLYEGIRKGYVGGFCNMLYVYMHNAVF